MLVKWDIGKIIKVWTKWPNCRSNYPNVQYDITLSEKDIGIKALQ